MFIDNAFHGGWNKNIGLGFEHFGTVFSETRKTNNAAGFQHVFAKAHDVDAIGINHGTAAFKHMGDTGAVFLTEKKGSVVTDIAQALYDDALIGQRCRKPALGHVFFMTEEFLQCVLHTAASGLGAPGDPALAQWFAGNTGPRIEISWIESSVFISHPRHFTCAGAHVRRGYILRWADETAFRQLLGKTAGDALEFLSFPFPRINGQGSFRAAEGNFHQRTFVGH